jgi:hypothetical protein
MVFHTISCTREKSSLILGKFYGSFTKGSTFPISLSFLFYSFPGPDPMSWIASLFFLFRSQFTRWVEVHLVSIPCFARCPIIYPI